MKKIPLSSPAVRRACVIVDALMAALAAVWLALAFSWLAVVAAAALAVLLGFYTVQVFRCAVLYDPDAKIVTLRGMGGDRVEVSAAAAVCTRETALRNQTTRIISVEDADGVEITAIPTLITVNSGYGAEVPARALAEAMGVAFRPTVDPALYDRAARRAAREKAKREKRRRRGEPEPLPGGTAESAGPEINYDELDDEPDGSGDA